jgi:hypothetical protein
MLKETEKEGDGKGNSLSYDLGSTRSHIIRGHVLLRVPRPGVMRVGVKR